MEKINFVTFNLRCVWKDACDGKNSFIHRAALIYEKIKKEMPDVLAFQEVRQNHLELLERMLPEYAFYGQFRNEDFTGEGIYTAVKKDRFQVLSFDTYWISPSPYLPGSRYENQSECPRICGTVKLREKTGGKIFRTFNIHLDHISDEARVLGIKCVLEKLDKYLEDDNIPFIIGGDFNALPDSIVIKTCNDYEKYKIFDVTEDIEATFHNWGKCKDKIDYVYVTEEIKKNVESVTVWDDVHEGIYLSDHYPISVNFEI